MDDCSKYKILVKERLLGICQNNTSGHENISRRTLLRMVAGAGIVTLSDGVFAIDEEKEKLPNIVLIIVDDLGCGQVSCYPHTLDVRTPNIDRLAEGGIRLTDGYAADGMCWPSRGSILTGRYHQRWGSRAAVPASELMIGDYLKNRGYITGSVGKWHNTGSIGQWDKKMHNHPSGRGFDEFFGFLGGMHDYYDSDLGTHFKQGKNRPHYMPIYEGTNRITNAGYLTEAFTDRALRFISKHHNHPFFLYVAYNAIHTPHQAPKRYLAKHKHRDPKDAGWLAMLDVLDEGVGKILDLIKQSGIEKNTIVMFVGDNGAHIPGGNWKFRGQKGRFFEGGIRVPWLVQWPGHIPEGIYRQPVMHIDILPTLLSAAGSELPPDSRIDGVNQLPYWRSLPSVGPDRGLFWGRTNNTRYAVRQGQWKLVREADNREDEPELGLYRLTEDPSENHDVSKSQMDMVSNLSDLYQRWIKHIVQKKV